MRNHVLDDGNTYTRRLPVERDRKLKDEPDFDDLDNRAQQARRGHKTRELLDELDDELRKELNPNMTKSKTRRKK